MGPLMGCLKRLCLCWLLGTVAFGPSLGGQTQTYKVNPDSSPASAQQSPAQKNSTDSNKDKSQTAPPQKSLGWGSNIENARLARAAEMALKDGKYAAAVDFAQRATQGAPNDPQLWFLLGYAARLAGKIQLSIDSYNQGLHLNPTSLDGLSGLAQAYGRAGRVDEAQHILTQILAADPKRTGDLVILGELLMQAGQYPEALSTLRRAEDIKGAARLELLIALCYRHLNQPAEAGHYLEMARARAPNDPEVQRSLAGYYRETGNYEAAITALKPIADRSPALKAELAYTYQLSGKHEEAAKLYSQAADSAPKDLALQLSASQAQIGARSLDAGEKYLKRAAAIEPDNYRVHAIRGEMARIQEDLPSAVREYNAALAHLPPTPVEGQRYGIQLHMDLVELYKSLHDEAAAHSHLEIAQSQINSLNEQGPARPDFLRLRALIKMNAGDLEGAGQDVHEALTIDAKDPNTLQLDGDVLAKLGRPDEAIAAYRKILAIDPINRFALTSLGYTSREAGHDQDAEKYFQKLAEAYPHLYVPHLALGDMYTSRRNFSKAETNYRKAYELAPSNPLIVAGGMNAAIEARQYPQAAQWLHRASPEMQQDAQVMREKERYLRSTGDFQQSAEVGGEAIKKLPADRDVVVYLGYDLLHLERYDELGELISRYQDLFPKDPDIPLLTGYVHKHTNQLDKAQEDFTRALERDPNAVTAYVNRGYVLKDLHNPTAAAADFESALRLEPKNGEAHLGLAYSSLELHRPQAALRQAQLAEGDLGDSTSLHLIRATAYGELGLLSHAVGEYRLALKSSPDQVGLHFALADNLYGLHQYPEAISELQTVEKIAPGNSATYALLARSYAHMGDRESTLKYVALAEQRGENGVFISTADALSTIGDRDAAMQRFERALTAPDSDRLSVRLAIGKLMASRDEWDDARRQIALGLMEVRGGQAPPPSGKQYLQAADVFLSMHDFDLAQAFFQRALAAGAPESAVRIGLANTYLARGDTPRAAAQLALVRRSSNQTNDSEESYDYLLAKANVYRQQHHDTQALTAFAQAANAAGQDDAAQKEMLEVGGTEGLRINPKVSFQSNFSVAPIFEDSTIYVLDTKLGVTNTTGSNPALLPLPRSSLETQWTGAYRLHLNNLPDATGFFQVRNSRGDISLPSVNEIVNRDTTAYSFNFGLNPTFHLGNNVFSFNTGIQETIQRDSQDPQDMNQNLFRQFVYMSTSSFFNIISVNGYAIREAGPFTESDLSSRDLGSQLNFRIGRPWGKTGLLTGYGVRDLQFKPTIREFFFTSSYAGVERKVSDSFSFKVVAEYLRAWRVEGTQFAIAQALRPAGSVSYSPTRNWSINGTVAYSRNMGFHVYDAVQSSFDVSYGMPVGRAFKDGGSELLLRYPVRFSFGLQQESFFNFTGGNSQQFRPFIQLSLF
jgi:tetratricopeptide (TPR) repeat protein